jgi:hypothetical protein
MIPKRDWPLGQTSTQGVKAQPILKVKDRVTYTDRQAR